jgi:type IX secretion system PorP/SprF family membrane protein
MVQNRTYIFLFLVLWLASIIRVNAQDMHFSQFTNSTQLYNPSLTGQYEQTVKASLLHRKQWRSIGKGYQTNAFDGQYKILSMYSKNYFGTGLFVLQDRAGIADLRTFVIQASGAYHMVVDNNNLISAGIILGYNQRSIDVDGLAWDSQFNGYSYDASLDNQERFVNHTKGTADIGIGLNWKYKGPVSVYAGYGGRHTRQDLSMLAKSSDKYALRHSFNAGLSKRIAQTDIKADVLVQRQAGATEIILGGTLDYRIGDDSRYTNVRTSSVVRGGIFYRVKDAIHPFVGFQYKRTAMFSFGYDIRLSKMSTVQKITGGPEISIAYMGTIGRSRMRIKH